MEFDKNGTKGMNKNINNSKMNMLHILFIIKQIFQHFLFHECVGVNGFAMENCNFGLEKVLKK